MLVFYLLRLLLTSLWGVLYIVFIALILSQYCLFFLLFYMPFSCRFYVSVFLLFFKLQNYDIFFNFRNLFLFVHQVGRISFTKLAVFHSPSWSYFIHQVGRVLFTKLAVLVLWFLQRLYCRRLSVFLCAVVSIVPNMGRVMVEGIVLAFG